jgi:hypothetical protein
MSIQPCIYFFEELVVLLNKNPHRMLSPHALRNEIGPPNTVCKSVGENRPLTSNIVGIAINAPNPTSTNVKRIKARTTVLKLFIVPPKKERRDAP